MLLSRAEKARTGSRCGSDGGVEGDDSGVGDGRREGGGCKAARREQAGRGADRVARETNVDVGAGGGRRETNVDGRAGGGDSGGGILSGVVRLVVGMEAEGVLRAIVGYL